MHDNTRCEGGQCVFVEMSLCQGVEAPQIMLVLPLQRRQPGCMLCLPWLLCLSLSSSSIPPLHNFGLVYHEFVTTKRGCAASQSTGDLSGSASHSCAPRGPDLHIIPLSLPEKALRIHARRFKCAGVWVCMCSCNQYVPACICRASSRPFKCN